MSGAVIFSSSVAISGIPNHIRTINVIRLKVSGKYSIDNFDFK